MVGIPSLSKPWLGPKKLHELSLSFNSQLREARTSRSDGSTALPCQGQFMRVFLRLGTTCTGIVLAKPPKPLSLVVGA